jgi:hypothetical protein
MHLPAQSADPLGLDCDLPVPTTISVRRAGVALGLGRVRLAELIAADNLKAVTIRRAKHVTMESLLAYVRNLREFEFGDWTSWNQLCGREGPSGSESGE